MRTTITLPDPLFRRAKKLSDGKSFSEFVRQAIADRVKSAERESLSREMEEGYRLEAQSPTLDPAWTSIETEDW